MHEKAKIALSELNDFVTKEYVKTKTLEETFLLIDELRSLENHLSEIEAQRENLKDERVPLEKEIAELKQKTCDLESTGPIDKLKLVNAEIESLSSEVKHCLRHLQKLVRLLDEGKLKLKADKARKAEQSAADVLRRDSLASLQARCKEMAVRKQQLLDSTKLDEIKRNLALLQDQIEHLKVRKASIESHEAVKEREQANMQEKLRNQKHAIEKNVLNFLGKKVQIR